MNRPLPPALRRALLRLAAFVIAASGVAAGATPVAAQEPAANATQLVVVTTGGWGATTGELRRFVRADVDSPWRPHGSAVPVVIGRTGLAWGVGFDALAGRDLPTAGPRKMEGDGRSPAGAYAFGRAFGFAPADSLPGLRLPYLPLEPGTECVDDTSSAYYNQVLDRASVARVDWSSAERMRRIAPYRLGVIVAYNDAPAVKPRGSCIFFHIWDGPGSTTAGCTALDAGELTRLVTWLDPEANPVVVQLPRDVYRQLRSAWALPPLEP